MKAKLKEDLLEILKAEKNLYQRLFEIAEAKNEALVKNDSDKLIETIEKDREVIAEIEKKDNERSEKIKEIKAEFELELENDSYSNLVKKLPAAWGEILNPLREELIELTDDFRKMNEQNQLLLEQALELNQLSLNTILENIEKEDTTYSKIDKNKKEQPRIIDRQG